MRIQILAFAQARDVLGFDERDIDFDSTAQTVTAEQLLEGVKPGLRAALPHGTRVAIDLEYSAWDAQLHDGQTLAIIPPVSGG